MGAGGGNAQGAAQEQERARQALISKNVKDINSAYSGREGQYNDFIAAVRKQYGDELTKQHATASRGLKFALARGGLTGGSAAVDAGKQLGNDFTQGTLTAEQKASGALAALKSKDEASRLQMISLAQSGSDIGNAATQTANALRASLEGARSENVASGLGQVFGGTADIYKQMQESANLRRGLRNSEIYSNPFSRGSGAGSSNAGGQ